MNRYDLFQSRRMLRNALKTALSEKALLPRIFTWIGQNDDEITAMDAAFLLPEYQKCTTEDLEDVPSFRRRAWLEKEAQNLNPHEVRKFVEWAASALDQSLASPPRKAAEARATALIVRRFGLGGACGPVLELSRLYAARRSPVEVLWDGAKEWLGDHGAATAVLLGVSRSAVERAFRSLTEVGLADGESWGASTAEPDDYTARWLERVYSPPVASEAELRERLVPLAPEPLLDLDDFNHLDERDDAVGLLSGALAARESVRVLFHGRAGTGKTEFAKTLARAAGARLYDLRDPEKGLCEEESQNRGTDSAAVKRNRLRMAQALLRSEPGAAILCDEVEDILESSSWSSGYGRHYRSHYGKRSENHRLLEEAAVPMIFTGNSLAHFDEAMLRRFDLVIRFKAHSPTRRRSVVRRMLAGSGLESLSGDALDPVAMRLADELECPPGLLERAIRSTRLVGGSADDLFRFAERHERTVSTHIARPRLGPPVRAGLSWDAFGHLGEPAEDVRRTLSAVLCARRQGNAEGSGMTFLAYGPPGCGKTEFAKTLAAEAGATLYAIGQKEHGPDARLAVDRSTSLRYAIEALSSEPEAVVLFDELEDFVFGEVKQWLNSLVESTPVPLLFTANSIAALRWGLPHFLDRVTCSLEFRHLPRTRRASMFSGLLDRNGAGDMAPLAEELAADRRITPRQAENAGRVAALSGGGTDAARRAVEQKAHLLRGKGTAEARPVKKYDFSLVHAEPDLAALTDRIVGIGRRRAGILLDGPSGSGKSEYAKQLAKRMDLDPLPKRASDLMSKWVGETEQQIAGAFREARATESFLIIDEADSLLADRRGAQRNWEISQVNEMLSQLENHDLPYAFTTNLADRLDPAVARRFLFRASFRFLDRARVERAWEFFFGGEAPDSVAGLTRLVPADFALAHERADKLGFLRDAGQVAAELVAQARDRNRTTAIGF